MNNFKNVKIIKENEIVNGDLIFENNFLSFKKNNLEGKEYNGKIILPGFIDIHTHGCINIDFANAYDESEIGKALNFYVSKGVTSIYPTLMTESDLKTFNQLELLYKCSLKNPMIKGIHIEGPFISKEFKGAQPENLIQKPSISKINKFIEHSHGLLKYMTIAPELEGAYNVIRYLKSKGIKVAMGHSSATFDETRKGMENGATSITHCFNAMKGIHQHFPSISAAALYFDDLYTEVILDGIHVVPEMVERIRKVKGNNKIVGITDSIMAAGLGDGEYLIGETPVVVKNGDAKLKSDGTRAGSCLTMDNAFKNIKKFSSLNDIEASHITALNAAKLMGIDNIVGSIKEGKSADFIVLNKNYEIEEVYLGGNKVF